MIFNVGCEGVAKNRKQPAFSLYVKGTETPLPAGQYAFASDAEDGVNVVNWELALYTSCTIKFDRVVPVDIFLVGGGGTGGSGYASGANACYGGSGGNGGERITRTSVEITEGQRYAVTIGNGGEQTTFLNYVAHSGNNGDYHGSAGGTGGGADSSSSLGVVGADGVVAFNTHATSDVSKITALIGRKYGAGGGGAPARSGGNPHVSYAVGAKAGGTTGGGTSGSDPAGGNVQGQRIGYPGQANTGAGGGGSCGDRLTGSYPAGASGGSGIIIIRNAR